MDIARSGSSRYAMRTLCSEVVRLYTVESSAELVQICEARVPTLEAKPTSSGRRSRQSPRSARPEFQHLKLFGESLATTRRDGSHRRSDVRAQIVDRPPRTSDLRDESGFFKHERRWITGINGHFEFAVLPGS
jgi:hypothetical protein